MCICMYVQLDLIYINYVKWGMSTTLRHPSLIPTLSRSLHTSCNLQGRSPPADEAFGAHPKALEAVQLRPDVEVEVQRGLPFGSTGLLLQLTWIGLPLVEVDDIFDLLAAAALDDPVVSVEGLGVAHQTAHAGFGADGAGA